MSDGKLNMKKILEGVKSVRVELEGLLKDRTWAKEARKLAERQGKEVKKIIDSDVAKLRAFLEEERKELEKLQAQIPGEVAKIKKFVDSQKDELSKLLSAVKKKTAGKAKARKGSSASKKRSGAAGASKGSKKTASKKPPAPKSPGTAS